MARRQSPRPEPPAVQSRRAAREAWLTARQADAGNLTLGGAFTQGWDAALLAVADAARAEDAGLLLWEAWRTIAERHRTALIWQDWEYLSATMRAVCADVAATSADRAIHRVKWASGDLGGKAEP